MTEGHLSIDLCKGPRAWSKLLTSHAQETRSKTMTQQDIPTLKQALKEDRSQYDCTPCRVIGALPISHDCSNG